MSGRAWRVSWLDLLLAAAVSLTGVVESYGRAGTGWERVSEPALLSAGAIAAGGMLVLRRRYPLAMLLALTAMSALLWAVADDGYPYVAWQTYSTLILVHTVGSAAPLRSWYGIAGLAGTLLAYGRMQTLPDSDFAERMITAVFIGVAYTSGILLRRQTERTLRLAEQNARLELEQAERDRRVVADERARIARELHDVITHNVSLMTLQAGGIRVLLGKDRTRDRERDLLRAVERSGRETVEELRLMLGVLRDPDHPDGPLLPSGLDRLGELAQQVGQAGLRVDVRVEGEPRALRPAVDLSAYRVAQEALTNVLKHARATRAEVTVEYAADRLLVRVTDDGTGPASTVDASTVDGHGLVGMRERTAMHGGSLDAGPGPDGGYRVVATFPLSHAAA
ncbi:sensor histidine kinase [Phytohabitans flavus]|uniref:histidine kinase n=1 Tax=Phytohabitans flavus TaxID=1076124 RepID=A0A6F8XVU5_9ACTN|nr:sensor histidine kinase [Phytohabitans flavus]BCB77940.1 ATPase [Phytohabitans flavus]